MSLFSLNNLHYDDDVRGPLRLYVYGSDERHSGGQWFRKVPKYPDEEITAAAAHVDAERAIAEKNEVRITNGNDFLVFHAVDGKVVYPDDAEAFWGKVIGR